ncbi:MAG TPA: CoA pyrophosphatase [Candidatus Dormibacteraeota bacterium]
MQTLSSLLLPVDGWGGFRTGSRPAAVTVVLYRSEGEWSMPFVRRRADLADHPGQVALPGGGVRAGETAWEAAAREVEEEIGVPAGALTPLGAGQPVYASVSNFHVVPFVAWSPDPELAFAHDPGELEGVLEIPLLRLLDEAEWKPATEAWMGRYFMWDGVPVWGLTERLLADLLPKIRTALDAGRTPDPPAAPR